MILSFLIIKVKYNKKQMANLKIINKAKEIDIVTDFTLPSPIFLDATYNGDNSSITPFTMADIISKADWEANGVERVELIDIDIDVEYDGPRTIIIHGQNYEGQAIVSRSYNDSVGFEMDDLEGEIVSAFTFKAYDEYGESNDINVEVRFHDDSLVITPNERNQTFSYNGGSDNMFYGDMEIDSLTRHINMESTHFILIEQPKDFSLVYDNEDETGEFIRHTVQLSEKIKYSDFFIDFISLYRENMNNYHGEKEVSFKYVLFDEPTNRYSNEVTVVCRLVDTLDTLEVTVEGQPFINASHHVIKVKASNLQEPTEAHSGPCPLLDIEVLEGKPLRIQQEGKNTIGSEMTADIDLYAEGGAGIRKLKFTVTDCSGRIGSVIKYFQLGKGECEEVITNSDDAPVCIDKSAEVTLPPFVQREMEVGWDADDEFRTFLPVPLDTLVENVEDREKLSGILITRKIYPEDITEDRLLIDRHPFSPNDDYPIGQEKNITYADRQDHFEEYTYYVFAIKGILKKGGLTNECEVRIAVHNSGRQGRW